MTRRTNTTGVAIRSPFIPGEYAEPGEIVDLPDMQDDESSPVIYSEDVWTLVEELQEPATNVTDRGAS